MAIDIFQSLKNCVFDLQRADVQNYQQPLKQLARLLNSENLQSVNAHLTRNVELDTFLARSEDTESSMAGSAVLQWPDEPADILGLKLLLIEKMADDNNFSFNFCHTFFYDRNIIESIRKFTCVFRSIRSRIGIEVRSAIRIHSINRELNFFYRFLTRFFAAFHYRGIFPQ